MCKQRNYRAKKSACLFAALGIWMLPAVSVAQQYYDPGLLQKTVDRRPVDYQAPGVRAGSFTLNPGVELAWEDNDNIFYLNKNEISDNILHIRLHRLKTKKSIQSASNITIKNASNFFENYLKFHISDFKGIQSFNAF